MWVGPENIGLASGAPRNFEKGAWSLGIEPIFLNVLIRILVKCV